MPVYNSKKKKEKIIGIICKILHSTSQNLVSPSVMWSPFLGRIFCIRVFYIHPLCASYYTADGCGLLGPLLPFFFFNIVSCPNLIKTGHCLPLILLKHRFLISHLPGLSTNFFQHFSQFFSSLITKFYEDFLGSSFLNYYRIGN